MLTRLPVLERIMLNLVATAQTIKPAAGYTNECFHRRLKVRGNTPEAAQVAAGKFFVVLALGSAVRIPDTSQDKSGWLQNVIVDAFVCPDEANQQELDARIASAVADLEKAFTREETSYIRGGLAFDTWLDAWGPWRRGPFLGATLRFIVHYETIWRDPYTSSNSLIDPTS